MRVSDADWSKGMGFGVRGRHHEISSPVASDIFFNEGSVTCLSDVNFSQNSIKPNGVSRIFHWG